MKTLKQYKRDIEKAERKLTAAINREFPVGAAVKFGRNNTGTVVRASVSENFGVITPRGAYHHVHYEDAMRVWDNRIDSSEALRMYDRMCDE